MICQSKKEMLTQKNLGDGKWGPSRQWSFEFSPVYGTEGENKSFWESTPSGRLELSCIQEDLFEVGKSYYLDFIVAP